MAKNKRWTDDEDFMILDRYVRAPKRKRLSLAQLTVLFHIEGYNRTQDAIRSRAHFLRRMVQQEGTRERQEQWFDGATFGFLDIETYGFKANFGLMLSWAMFVPDEVRVRDDGTMDVAPSGKTYFDAMSRKEAINYKKLDKRITGTVLDAIEDVDIVVGYYSTKFDIPFIRTRAAMWDYPRILYQDKYHYDMWFTVRSLYKLTRNSLEQACAMVGIEGKTHVDYALWDRARLGDGKAMQYILEHNIADVEILAELYNRISGQRPLPRRSL